MNYYFDTIRSAAYWKFALLSRQGLQTVLAVFGALYLILEILDFFKILESNSYPSYSFAIFLAAAILLSIIIRRPVRSITIALPNRNICLEVKIGNIFDCTGSLVISTNTTFEADVAGKKIHPDSLQGQFTARYFTGSQVDLIKDIRRELKKIGGTSPYPLGTTIPITTHSKTFYFVAMSELNEEGNAASSLEGLRSSLDGLWRYVSDSGELQELAIPVMGTGRGRLATSRQKIIQLIAESFVSASHAKIITNKLVIVLRHEDAKNSEVNLWEVKDDLRRALGN